MNQTAQQAAEAYLNRIDPGEDFTRSESEIGSAAFLAGWEAGQPNWIPVTERPPDLDENATSARLLIRLRNGRITIGLHLDGEFVLQDESPAEDIIAWCAIPDSLLNFKP